MKKTILAAFCLFLAVSLTAQNKCLEGDVIYRTYNQYSEFLKSLSPQFINGVDTVYVTIKGSRIHEHHKSNGVHVVYDNNERIRMWSDFTKEGFDLPYVVQLPGQSPATFKTNEKKIIAGKEGVLYKNVIDIMGTVAETEMFIADTEIPIGPNAICILNVSNFGKEFENKMGVKTVVRQYQTGKMLEISKKQGHETWSTQATELIGLQPRNVEDAEFLAPNDIKMEYKEVIEPAPELKNGLVQMTLKATLKSVNKDSKKYGIKLTMEDVEANYNFGQFMMKFHQQNAAFLRENNLVNDQVIEERVVYNIEEEWDF